MPSIHLGLRPVRQTLYLKYLSKFKLFHYLKILLLILTIPSFYLNTISLRNNLKILNLG